ncbi:MAG: AsmA-like C-terminal region-containing protein [Chthoniobacterales bacterium]
MQKAGRIALLTTGVVCALLAVALLAVNLYVQSRPTQARIQQELSQRLGATLQIRRISVTPWWGLKLTGITMPQEPANGLDDFLHAQTFRLRVRLGSLFSPRLVISEVLLIKPTVIWAQNPDGRWRLPSARTPAPTEAPAPAPAPPPASAVPGSRPAAVAADSPAGDVEQSGRFTPEVRRVRLMDGNFRFLDTSKKPVASFEGVRFRSDFRNATALRGAASIAKISLRGRFFLEHLQSPLTYDRDELNFAAIRAEAAGGQITGSFRMRPAEPESPFHLVVDFHDLDTDHLIVDAHGPAGMLLGKIEGHLEADGQTGDPNALRGAGEIYLRDGQVRQYSLLVALAQLLQVDELRQLHFDEAHVRYRIEPGIVAVDDLLLSSANIRLSATGTITFAGKLQLESRLSMNESIRRKLFRAIRDRFEPSEEAGFAAVSFRIGGTLERPKTDLVEKLVGPELKDLGSVISGFFGGRKSDRVRKKRKDDPVAPEPAAPAPSPVPDEAPVEPEESRAPEAPSPAASPA